MTRKIIASFLILTFLFGIASCKKADSEQIATVDQLVENEKVSNNSNDTAGQGSSVNNERQEETVGQTKNPEEPERAEGQTEKEDNTIKNENNSTGDSSEKDHQQNETNSEPLAYQPMHFDSLEEFFETIREPTDYLETYNGFVPDEALTELEYFYLPSGFEGYELEHINFRSYDIVYTFSPINGTEKSLTTEMIVARFYPCDETKTGESILAETAQKEGLSITSDGILYEPKYRRISFPIGKDYMTLTAPYDADIYEQLKSLCVINKYVVRQEDGVKSVVLDSTISINATPQENHAD